ncbi:hypothetical protein [Nocardia terpenica]|uniref:hypothetical protein n=1 Tax=Nocardia terpenica TaxID=455432 RepID=UPI0012FE1956|nr:hypothetical protein [Nocardia terpenica]
MRRSGCRTNELPIAQQASTAAAVLAHAVNAIARLTRDIDVVKSEGEYASSTPAEDWGEHQGCAARIRLLTGRLPSCTGRSPTSTECSPCRPHRASTAIRDRQEK